MEEKKTNAPQPQSERSGEKPSRLRAVNRALAIRSPKQKRYTAVRTVRTDGFVLETRTDAIRKPFPYAVILSFLAVVAVAMYVLSLRITLDNLTADISRMEREILAYREEQNVLEVRVNAKYDLSEIERIAREEYGMVPKDSLTKKYIPIAGEDEVQVLDPETGEVRD